jgi:Sec-independent protein translocase protein TatA
MRVLGVGNMEFFLIVLLAGIVLGPERLARTARKAGTMIKEVKAYFSELSSGLKEELDLLDELEEIKKNLDN